MIRLTLISIFIILFGCNTDQPNETATVAEPEGPSETNILDDKVKVKATSKPCESINLISNSDSCSCEDYGDSIIYYYTDYIVMTQPHQESNGNIVEIRNKKYGSKKVIGEENSAFFMGIHKNNAIIDEGTGQIRQIIVLDAALANRTYFNDSYVNDLRIEDGFLFIEQPIDAEYVDPKPVCPEELKGMEDYIGYVGVYKYEFKNKTLAFTGEFKCQYFE